jgi:hypothetical protein
MRHEDDLRHKPPEIYCNWQAVAVAVASAVASAAAQRAFAKDPPEVETASAPDDTDNRIEQAGEDRRKRLRRQQSAEGPQRTTGGFNLNKRQPALGQGGINDS